MRRLHRLCARRGSVLVLSIVVSIVISGLIVTMAWVAGTQSQITGDMSKMDQAFFAAESGVQRVAWYCKNNKMSSITSPVSGTCNGYSYSTSWTNGSGSSILITSIGSVGTISYTMTTTVTPPAPAIPAFASVGNFDNKNISIVGNVGTAGSYTNGGMGSLSGNLIYGTTASNTGSVGGTVSKGTLPTIDFTALDTTLKSGATTKGTGVTYDFTTVSGTNKVIYVNGSVTDPTIIGSGTLYVNGTITFTHPNQVVGTAGSPVDLVATGDIDFQKKATINGALYSKGDWNRAQVDLTGVVYVGGISPSNSGSSTLTVSSVPWFDPRAPGGSGGGAANLTFSNFTGPQP